MRASVYLICGTVVTEHYCTKEEVWEGKREGKKSRDGKEWSLGEREEGDESEQDGEEGREGREGKREET